MGRKLNIRPTSGVYATYKRLSYQPWTAIAEFVDNSTQSFYDHKEELLSTKYYKGLNIHINYVEDNISGDRIEILDNAYGMEWFDFQRAVVLDKPPVNNTGRNEFGMGLKTAACWFGSLWSVESTQLNSKIRYYVEIDVDEIGKYKTEEINVKEDIVSEKEHYTKIIIQKLNKKISGARTVGKVKELISSIYREDLRSGLINIYYNGTQLAFKETPIFIETDRDGNTTEWKKEVFFDIDYENTILNVHGFIALRIPGSTKDAGFTLLRRGRVIVGGSEHNYRPTELFGESNSYTYQRLFGELHMDNWPVTQAKDAFDWHNSGLEELFILKLQEYTKDFRKKAEDYRVREKANTEEIIKVALDELSEIGLFEDYNLIEETEDEEISTNKDVTMGNNTNVQLSSEVDFEGANSYIFSFAFRGNLYKFRIVLEISDPNLHWLVVNDNSNNEYVIRINMLHAFFKQLSDNKNSLPLLIKLSIALVLAEIESIKLSSDLNKRIYPSDIRMKMNEILEVVRRGDMINEI